VKLLLDSHVFLWWLGKEKRLLGRLFDAVRDPANEKFVSAASVWELEIKRNLGRLATPPDMAEALRMTGFTTVPVTPAHAIAAAGLPPHHADPFDRMLIAQAKLEGFTVATVDHRFAAYGVPVIG
jgi:PIN domain nuclease of toxin-antitoxin system